MPFLMYGKENKAVLTIAVAVHSEPVIQVKKVGKIVTFDINLDKDYFNSVSDISNMYIIALYKFTKILGNF